jgi:hypothetical protein
MPALMRSFAIAIGLPIWLAALPSAHAQGGGASSFQGRTITAEVKYETWARRNGREFDNPVRFVFVVNVGRDGKVNGTATRHVVGPRGPQSETRSFSASLGKAEQVREGHRLMVINGNTLTMLRTFEAGGAKTTITMNGSGCTIRAPIMKEVGAGPMRRQAVVGGTIEILRSRQVSTSCRIQ